MTRNMQRISERIPKDILQSISEIRKITRYKVRREILSAKNPNKGGNMEVAAGREKKQDKNNLKFTKKIRRHGRCV